MNLKPPQNEFIWEDYSKLDEMLASYKLGFNIELDEEKDLIQKALHLYSNSTKPFIKYTNMPMLDFTPMLKTYWVFTNKGYLHHLAINKTLLRKYEGYPSQKIIEAPQLGPIDNTPSDLIEQYKTLFNRGLIPIHGSALAYDFLRVTLNTLGVKYQAKLFICEGGMDLKHVYMKNRLLVPIISDGSLHGHPIVEINQVKYIEVRLI